MFDHWTEENLHYDGDQYFASLIKDIELAHLSIDFETYIFEPDAIGREFEKALAAAAKRGVKVRVLVDGLGAWSWLDRSSPHLARQGVEIHVFHPLILSRIFTRLSRLNQRTHRKMCIIDHQKSYIGSLNISIVHSKKNSGARAWRDIGVEIQGQPVRDLETAFEHAWRRSHNLLDGKRHWLEAILSPALNRVISRHVRLNYTARLRRKQFRELLMRIRTAKRRIWITNAYISPARPILSRLKNAARNGIDVRLLVPKTSDVFFMPWVATSHYAALMSSGVRIFEYQPRFLHSKSVIIDAWVTVGTSNLNRRSLLHDLEVDVVLSKPNSLLSLESNFAIDLRDSTEVVSPPNGWSTRIGRLILFFFRRWI
jgi:cardiolipin synthase